MTAEQQIKEAFRAACPFDDIKIEPERTNDLPLVIIGQGDYVRDYTPGEWKILSTIKAFFAKVWC